MRLSSFLSVILLAAISSTAASQQDVRRKANSRGCKILLVRFLRAPDTDVASFQDHRFDCELDPSDTGGIAGIVHPINFSDTQRKEMLRKYKKGEAQHSPSILVFKEGSVELGDDVINVAPTADLTASVAGGEPLPSIASNVEGDKSVLIVRVTDKDGQVVPRSAAEIGDDVLGTLGDPVNPKSQFKACSFDKFRLYGSAVPGQSARGVIDVTINVSNQESNSVVQNAVTDAVTAQLGSGSFPNDFDHVLYVLHSGANAYVSYAYVSHHLSVYFDIYSSHNGILMHGLGFNLGLMMSGEAPASTGDFTCAMGSPPTHYTPDGARMCFNGAKSWQLGWYDDKEAEVTKDNAPWFGELVGLTNYDTAGSRKVGIKLQRLSSSTDYYIQFNHAVGINIDNGEYSNEVVIVEQSGEGSSPGQSWTKAHLSTGQTYSFSNFDNSGQTMSVTVNSINTDEVAGFASLSICLGPCSTPSPVTPTRSPTTYTPPCVDSAAWFWFVSGMQDCIYVKYKFIELCESKDVKTLCPDACGACEEYGCEDDPYGFYLDDDSNGKEWTCGELANLDQSEIDTKCGTTEFSTTCRNTCGLCHTPEPTISPIPSQSPAPSGGPTILNFDDQAIDEWSTPYLSDDIVLENFGIGNSNSAFFAGSGVQFGVISQPNVAFNNDPHADTTISCPDGSFSLISLYVTNFSGGPYVDLEGYRDGTRVAAILNAAISLTTPTFFDETFSSEWSNFVNIDTLQISTNIFLVMEDVEVDILSPCTIPENIQNSVLSNEDDTGTRTQPPIITEGMFVV